MKVRLFDFAPFPMTLGRTSLPSKASLLRRDFSPNCWGLRSSAGIEPDYNPPELGPEAQHQPSGPPHVQFESFLNAPWTPDSSSGIPSP